MICNIYSLAVPTGELNPILTHTGRIPLRFHGVGHLRTTLTLQGSFHIQLLVTRQRVRSDSFYRCISRRELQTVTIELHPDGSLECSHVPPAAKENRPNHLEMQSCISHRGDVRSIGVWYRAYRGTDEDRVLLYELTQPDQVKSLRGSEMALPFITRNTIYCFDGFNGKLYYLSEDGHSITCASLCGVDVDKDLLIGDDVSC